MRLLYCSGLWPRYREHRLTAKHWIISYPKSGRSWLRAMIGHYLCCALRLPLPCVPHTAWLAHTYGIPPWCFNHAGSDLSRHDAHIGFPGHTLHGEPERLIYLYRHPADTLVSGYYQLRYRLKSDCPTIDTCVLDPRYGIDRWLLFHQRWSQYRPRKERLLVSYEALHTEPAHILDRVLRFMGIPAPVPAWCQYASTICQFQRMQQDERDNRYRSAVYQPNDPALPASFKTRQGRIGGYRTVLHTDTIACLKARVQQAGLDWPDSPPF